MKSLYCHKSSFTFGVLFFFFVVSVNSQIRIRPKPKKNKKQGRFTAVEPAKRKFAKVPKAGTNPSSGITFTWSYPFEKETQGHGSIKIKLKVTSSTPLNEEDFEVEVNKVVFQNTRADEVSLIPTNKEVTQSFEYIFSQVVPLNHNSKYNLIRVKINGERSSSRIIRVSKNDNVQVAFADPNPRELFTDVYLQTDPVMLASWTIQSTLKPDKEKIKIYLDDVPVEIAPQSIETRETLPNTHLVFIKISHLAPSKIQELHMTYKGVSSERLTFKYVPQDRPSLYVISFGPDAKGLDYTAKDALDFANLFRTQAGKEGERFFKEVSVTEFTGKKATITGMMKKLGRPSNQK